MVSPKRDELFIEAELFPAPKLLPKGFCFAFSGSGFEPSPLKPPLEPNTPPLELLSLLELPKSPPPLFDPLFDPKRPPVFEFAVEDPNKPPPELLPKPFVDCGVAEPKSPSPDFCSAGFEPKKSATRVILGLCWRSKNI